MASPYIVKTCTSSTTAQNKPEGIKFDVDKERWDLIPFHALQQVVKVITFGANKYGANNWQSLENGQDRYFAAAMRHLCAVKEGIAMDDETNLHHLAHAACNIMFMLDYQMFPRGTVPRPREEAKKEKKPHVFGYDTNDCAH